jgi:hypothetical protein
MGSVRMNSRLALEGMWFNIWNVQMGDMDFECYHFKSYELEAPT